MVKMHHLLSLFFCFTTQVTSSSANSLEVPPLDELSIFVPGSPGGGYDHTAKALAASLLEEKLVEAVDIVHVVGAGGTIALSTYINRDFKEKYAVLLAGKSTIGSVFHNNSRLSLFQTHPIARIASKPLAIAVPTDSPIESVDDLIHSMQTDVQSVKWIGGSAGAADNLLLKDISRLFKFNLQDVNYRPIPGGGSAVVKQLTENGYTAAISTVDEFNDARLSGLIRLIAVSSEKRIANLEVPTLKDSGIDIDWLDWHGVFASARFEEQKLERLNLLISAVTKSEYWKSIVAQQHWQDTYLDKQAFIDYVRNEQHLLLKAFQFVDEQSPSNSQLDRILNTPYRWVLYLSIACLFLSVTLIVSRLQNVARAARFQKDLKMLEVENQQNQEKLSLHVESVSQKIQREFANWNLTTTEQEVAMLMLKGLSFKEIARYRCKSERTVRQQAGNIYAKSSLTSRSDLAAHFLEEFIGVN